MVGRRRRSERFPQESERVPEIANRLQSNGPPNRIHMIVTLIAAVAENGVIGRDSDMPWRLKSDLKRFRARTMGKPVVMGRKTYPLDRPAAARAHHHRRLARSRRSRARASWSRQASSRRWRWRAARRCGAAPMRSWSSAAATSTRRRWHWRTGSTLPMCMRSPTGDALFPAIDPASGARRRARRRRYRTRGRLSSGSLTSGATADSQPGKR